MESDRRTFVKTMASMAVGATGLARPGTARSIPVQDQLDRIGVQLYTVSRTMAEDFEGTLERIASIGYDEVEFAGYFERTPVEVRSALEAAGMQAPSAHINYAVLQDGWDRILDDSLTIGHSYLICPSLPGEVRRSLDGYRRVTEVFNRAGEQARAAGIQFGYHNHTFEFEAIEGQVPYDLMIAETDPRFVTFQLDLFWIRSGGGDPLAYFARHPGRFSSVHVKDMDGSPEQRMVDVGKGVIDFAAIFAQRERAGIEHFFIEHDQPEDPLESVRASYQYLARLTF